MEKKIEYGMVDLGLPSGLKWSDRNVGAESPEAYGDYFMWGSVTPGTDNVCDWAHTPFNDGATAFNETYFKEHKSEWLTDECTLKPEYDAAHVNMGDSWRIPTSVDMRELIDGTAQKVEEVNGIKGMRFTAPNGNSIFMPFTGRRYDSYAIGVGDHGGAWSSSLEADYVSCSRYTDFVSEGCAGVHISSRCHGFVVRGVCQ